MDGPIGYNVYNTAFMPPKFMVYSEKHHLHELGLDLITYVNVHHPRKENLEQFIHDYLENIGVNYLRNIGVVVTPPNINPYQVANKYNELYQSPIIQYTKKRTPGDIPCIIHKLNVFLRHYKFEHKDLMLFNFPGNRDDALACSKYEFVPNFVMELKFPQSHKPICPCPDPDLDGYQLEKFYDEKYSQLQMPETLKNISRKIHSKFRSSDLPDASLNRYVPRVVIIGRRGSGRKLQANLLSHEFNLVYIDVEYLLLKHLYSNSPMGRALSRGCALQNYSPELMSSMLLSRLLEPDCLTNGWVIVGFPNTRQDLELIVADEFIVPPNKIIFLHTRERVCLRRLAKKAECATYQRLCDNVIHIRKEFEFFNFHIRDMATACETRKETIHIDGNHSTNTVKNTIWRRVLQEQRF